MASKEEGYGRGWFNWLLVLFSVFFSVGLIDQWNRLPESPEQGRKEALVFLTVVFSLPWVIAAAYLIWHGVVWSVHVLNRMNDRLEQHRRRKEEERVRLTALDEEKLEEQARLRALEEERLRKQTLLEALEEKKLAEQAQLKALAEERLKEQARLRAQEEQMAEALRREHEQRRLREEEEFRRADKHLQCKHDNRFYPVYLIPICPFCGKGDNQVLVRADAAEHELLPGPEQSMARPNKLSEDPVSLPNDLEREIESFLDPDVLDFRGVGNLVLDELMTVYEGRRPSVRDQYLVDNVPKLIARKFRIPEKLAYGMPHRDIHLPAHLRKEWKEDVLPQLIISAYVFGATRQTLAYPHDKLLPYYQLMAERQLGEIKKARDEYVERLQQTLPEELEALRDILGNEEEDAELRMKAAAARVEKMRNIPKPDTKREPKNPDDLL